MDRTTMTYLSWPQGWSMKLLLKIEGVVPAKMPGRELAAYMILLARMLGARDQVHFTAIRHGSTEIETYVTSRAAHQVRQRMRAAENATVPTEARRQWAEMNGLLERRKTSAKLQEQRNDGKRVDRVYFPGVEGARPELPTIRDHVRVQGILFRIEGSDRTVHVGLLDGETRYNAVVSRDQAAEIVRTSSLKLVRVEGTAPLTRLPNGEWQTGEIDASTIEPLEDIPLFDTLRQIQGAGGFGWPEGPEGLVALEEIRAGE